MEPEHIIDETVTIRGADIETVYDDCLSWLKKKQATIKQEDKPFYLQATHIEHHGGRFIRVFKWIDIQLTEAQASVTINIKIDPPEGITLTRSQRRLEQYRLSWKTYVIGLWRNIGVEFNQNVERQVFSYELLENQVTSINRRIYLMIGLTLLFLTGRSLSGISSEVSRILSSFTVMNILVLIALYYQMMKMKKRVRELYPDR